MRTYGVGPQANRHAHLLEWFPGMLGTDPCTPLAWNHAAT
jgi:hypothetical protein